MDSIHLHAATVKGVAYAVMIDTDADVARVTSKSEPGMTHVLTSDGCDCEWAQNHRYDRPCAHQMALSDVWQRVRRDTDETA